MFMTDGIKRLVRPRAGRKIAGVCAGIADYFNVDVALVRVAWVVLSIVPGGIFGGIVAYLAAWIVMPEGTSEFSHSGPRRRLVRSATDRKLAGVCGGLAEYFDIDATALRLLWIVLGILPGAILGGIVVYVLAWIVMPKPSSPLAVEPVTAKP
jgi:phage shock protein PspC (stress-responsive transcriptional regulator)